MHQYVLKNPLKKGIVVIFDFLGRALTPNSPKSFKLDQVKKILLIRNDHIGDVMMTLPAIRPLREKLSNATIDLLVDESTAPILLNSVEFSDNLHVQKKGWFHRSASLLERWNSFWQTLKKIKKNNYDVAIDFRGDLRNNLLMAFAGIPFKIGRGITGGGFFLNFEDNNIQDQHQITINMNLLKNFGISAKDFQIKPLIPKTPFAHKDLEPKKYMIIHPGVGYEAKQWGAENFLKLLSLLQKDCILKIAVIGTKEERNAFEVPNDVLDLRGEVSLKDLPALIKEASIFIGNDSGPAHIAATQGIKTFVLFTGLNKSIEWAPKGPSVQVIEGAKKDILPETVFDCLKPSLTEILS